VAKVTWSGAPDSYGAFIVLMLDKRIQPPRPLDCRGGVTSQGPTPAAWSSALDRLAERYDWLAGITPIGNARGGAVAAGPTLGVFAPAQASGTVTVWCSMSGRDYVPRADPASEVIVALIYQGGDTQVRWARRVAG
jgi:hypothetical protein